MKNSLTTRHLVTKILAIGAATACAATLGVTTAMAAPPPSPQTSFPGAVPSWAKPANDQGAAPADTTVEGEIYLPLRNAAQAASFATDVSTPGNRLYKQAVSPAQWINTYSPTQANFDAVVNGLKQMGLSITAVPDSRLYVVFRGTPSQVDAAFATQLHTYTFEGSKLVGPSKVPSLPAAIASKVSGLSIDQGNLMTRPDNVKQGAGLPSTAGVAMKAAVPSAKPDIANTTACSNYFGENTNTIPTAYGKTTSPTFVCGYTPSQIQSAYGRNTLAAETFGSRIDGHGQTVAIIDAYASPTMLSDVNTYSSQYGLPQMTGQTYKQLVYPSSQFLDQAACQEPSGWQSEQTLDVDAVHGTAPGANILYVGGFNCGGGLDIAMSKILDNGLANIVSNSYGNTGEALPQDSINGEVNIQLQAAGEGIGLYFSSGDNGDEVANLGYASPDFPASSPWVTAVGGTSLAVGKTGNYEFETGWGDALDQIKNNAYTSPLPGNIFGGGGGGGVSAIFAQPAYQRGVVPASLAQGHRVSPDISSLADPYTGYVIGISPINNDSTLSTDPFTIETYGGTSLASPLTAGQMAVAQQVSGTRIGFANPEIYSLAKSYNSPFTDVTTPKQPVTLDYLSANSGNQYLLTLDQDTSLNTAVGYDDVTGVGSMSYRFAAALGVGGFGK